MRDLRKDWNVLYGIIDWIAIPKQQIVKEWLERAIKAEGEAERLKLMVKSITGGLDEAIEAVHFLETENAKLRAVAEAAREFFEGTGCEPKECNKCDPKHINFCERSGIEQALAELDKEERQSMKTNSKIREIVDFFELEEGWSKDEIISQVISEIKELKGYEADEITLLWDDEELMVLIDFAEQFFNKMIKNTCDVIKSFMDD